MTTEHDAVNEIIREENAPTTLDDVAKEIHGVMVVNQLLNNALAESTRQVAEMSDRIDRMLKIAKHETRKLNMITLDALERMTTGGTHRDKDEAQLQAIGHLIGLQRNAEYLNSLLGEAAHGAKRHMGRDMDDIPF